jgi:C4-dicarboxylate transporter, DctQ subunit
VSAKPPRARAGLQGGLTRLARIGTAVENGLLVLLLAILMVLAVGQIVLRIGLSSGVVWADELVKIVVLWLALVASVAASRSRRHLRIDLLNQFVPERLALLPGMIADAFAAAVCGVIAWHSFRYVQLSAEFQETVLLDTPAWIIQGVLPLAFALMTWRFTLHCLSGLVSLARGPRRIPTA